MGNRRRNVLLVCVIAFAVTVAGCSSDSESGGGSDASPAKSSKGLFFYDWGANLLGPAKVLVPQSEAPHAEKVLKAQIQKWKKAGRPPTVGGNRQLIGSGAEPTFGNAVEVAERENEAGHAPQGTVIVREQATGGAGEVVPGPPGYYVLNDDPAVTGNDIVNPERSIDAAGRPSVTFEFTEQGQKAFERLTRRVASEGRADERARCKSGCRAILILRSFAIVFDDRVLSRPVVDHTQFPDGLNGDDGIEISGGFDIEGAQQLAEELQTVSAKP